MVKEGAAAFPLSMSEERAPTTGHCGRPGPWRWCCLGSGIKVRVRLAGTCGAVAARRGGLAAARARGGAREPAACHSAGAAKGAALGSFPPRFARLAFPPPPVLSFCGRHRKMCLNVLIHFNNPPAELLK